MSPNPIDLWLDKVCSHLSGPRARARIRLELQNHMLDRVRLLMQSRGLSEEEAMLETAKRMGDPDEIGRALHCARLSPWRFLLWVGTLLIWAAFVFLLVHLSST